MPNNLEATAEEEAFFNSGGQAVPESMKHLANAPPIGADAQPGGGNDGGDPAGGEEEGQPGGGAAGGAGGAAAGGEGGEHQPGAGGEEQPGGSTQTPEQKAKLERPVPFAAVLDERGKRKSAEERARVAEEALARIRAGGGQPPAGQDPSQGHEGDGLPDPMGDIEALKRWRQQTEEERVAQQQGQQFQNGVEALERHYIASNPDYPEAVEFLKDAIGQQYRLMGYNDQQITQALAMDARRIAVYAVQTEQNPAELFHLLAKQRGFVPKADGGQQPGGQNGGGEPAPNAGVVRLDRLARGQKAAKSVSGGGGGAAAAGPSLAAILTMDGDEFDAQWKNGTVRKLMG